MSSLPECFAHLLACWNEHDPDKRRAHAEAAVTADVAFNDPKYQFVGIEPFLEMVAEFRAEEGDAKLAPASGVDMHNDRARYAWILRRTDGTRVEGFDAVALDLDQAKIRRIDGFFEALPAVEAPRVA